MMENKTKLTIGAIITLALAMSSTYIVSQDDDAYYCESKDMVMVCEKLSSGTGTRCYYESTYKICKEGWQTIQVGQEIVTEPAYPSAGGTVWSCSPEKCVKMR